jgi:hypothetical protein
MDALLPLGRQSNEGKRQCKAGDEGKRKTHAPWISDLTLGLGLWTT